MLNISFFYINIFLLTIYIYFSSLTIPSFLKNMVYLQTKLHLTHAELPKFYFAGN